MAAYTVIRTKVHDPVAYSAFVQRVTALMPEFGGEFAVRADRCVAPEGSAPDIVVIQRFPDMGSAQAYYDHPEYQEALSNVRGACTREVVIVEGV
ncbi:MAG: DUF1330 domain-containing protein [Gemmatimonadota bacterium]|nr:DUF1330 domain-containing protein [Gemmatimonadota bacterium]MDE2985613.1 DUF1330 domain-containing protein [Gemmatimonadota bacterium]